jgi:hypothetical protein
VEFSIIFPATFFSVLKFVFILYNRMPLEKILDRDATNNNGPKLAEDEAMHYTQPKVKLQFAKDTPEGQGTLYVTTK